MAVSPLGNAILVNQNMHIASNQASNLQNRFDLQNVAAMMRANEKREEIAKIRPTEETHYIGQDDDDYRKVEDEEKRKDSERGNQQKAFILKDEDNEDDNSPSLLDLKI
jgi:hypothetical protein